MHTDDESTPKVRASRIGSASATRLQGRWLLLGRIGWVLVAALSFGLFLLGLLPYATQLHMVCLTASGACYLDGALSPAGVQALHDLGVSVDSYVWYTVVVTVLDALVWMLVGFLIFWHRTDDWMALLAALFLVTFNPGLTGGPTTSLVHFSPLWTLPVECLDFLGAVLIGLFLYLFPNGGFVPRWMGWMLVPYFVLEIASIFPPLNSALNANNWPTWLYDFLLLTLVGSVVFSQIYRYQRISTPTERQQTKWVLFGIVIALVGMLALNLAPLSFSLQPGLFNVANDSLFFIVLLAIPLSIAVAMLRSRLYDIDVLINRTLVYGTLTAILTLTYVGLILALQSLTHSLTGQAGDQPVVIVGSTLVIAALFTPLRRRIQVLIDRRFYRRKYDAARTLAAFSATLRTEVDLEQLREQLVAVVQETMQPSHVSLWLRPPEPSRKRKTWLLVRMNEEERVEP
jgi:hypothetical protein